MNRVVSVAIRCCVICTAAVPLHAQAMGKTPAKMAAADSQHTAMMSDSSKKHSGMAAKDSGMAMTKPMAKEPAMDSKKPMKKAPGMMKQPATKDSSAAMRKPMAGDSAAMKKPQS